MVEDESTARVEEGIERIESATEVELDDDSSWTASVPFRLLPVSIAFLAMLGLSGLLLMLHYRPDATLASLDLIDLQQHGFLALVHEFHVWASMALVLLASLRLLGTLLYRAGEGDWRWRLALGWGTLVFAFAWTGHMLSRPSETSALASIYVVHVAVLPWLLFVWIAWQRGRRTDGPS